MPDNMKPCVTLFTPPDCSNSSDCIGAGPLTGRWGCRILLSEPIDKTSHVNDRLQ